MPGSNDMPCNLSPAEVAEAQASQARRMEIVGQLTGGVVHDFNNILTVISGTIDILAEAVADRPDLAAVAKLIDEAATRGAGLASSLLALSRGPPSQPREVDVVSLLADAARLLRPTLGELIEISAKPASGIPSVLADPSQLMMTILDLAIIARDVMPEGGRLRLEAEHTDSKGSAEGFVKIALSASWEGLIENQPELVFARLGIAEDFVRQSGGNLEVGSDAGETSVRMYLPTSVAHSKGELGVGAGMQLIARSIPSR